MTTVYLPLTQTAIADCRDLTVQNPHIDPVIGAYLTRYVNGLMCAEIESVVGELIKQRLRDGCADTATSNFLSSIGRSAIRNATISEIRDKMRLFGTDYAQLFDNIIDDAIGEAGREKLGVAVRNRNDNAHDKPVDITFNELEEAFRVATKVVDAVSDTLSSRRPTLVS